MDEQPSAPKAPPGESHLHGRVRQKWSRRGNYGDGRKLRAKVEEEVKKAKGTGRLLFQPGNASGSIMATAANPATFARMIRDYLATIDPKSEAGKTRVEMLIGRLYVEDPKLLLAYAFGKPMERIELIDTENRLQSMAIPHNWTVDEIRSVLITIRESKNLAEKQANVTAAVTVTPGGDEPRRINDVRDGAGTRVAGA